MEIEYLCQNCFADKSIRRYISRQSTKRIKRCPICQGRNGSVISLPQIAHHISNCIYHSYSTLESRDGIDYDPERNCFYYVDTNDVVEPTNFLQILEDHEVLSSNIEREMHQDVYTEIFKCIQPKGNIYTDLAESGWAHAQANALYLAWDQFNYSVQYFNRFFDLSDRVRTEYLDRIYSLFHMYAEELPSGTLLYRVRIDHDGALSQISDYRSALKEILPPPAAFTRSYRMSPQGITYAYLSDDKETSLQECDCNIGSDILLGTFKTSKVLQILNLEIKEPEHYGLFSGQYDREKENISKFIHDYSTEISKPVSHNDDSHAYLATQIIAEYVRAKGYDGIAYSSSRTGKTNYVLFYGPDCLEFPETRPNV